MFRKISMNTQATIPAMLVCRFVYAEALLDFDKWLEKTLHGKTLVMDSLYACNFIKKWLWHRCFSMNFAKLSRKTGLWNICKQTFLFLFFFLAREHLWCNKVLPYPCSIKDMVETYLKDTFLKHVIKRYLWH